VEVTLPPDLNKRVEQELASGRYPSREDLIEQAVRYFFDERQRGQHRLEARFRESVRRLIGLACMSGR
jgi:Arc/MetJ-type ribon-helix-helix transcriptional regulator